MTDQPKTATIPMDLLEKYVALQRAVESAMGTTRYDSNCKYYYKGEPEFKAISSAWLAISKLTNNEQGN